MHCSLGTQEKERQPSGCKKLLFCIEWELSHVSELWCFRSGCATTGLKIWRRRHLTTTYAINQVVRCSLRCLLDRLFHETMAPMHAPLSHFPELNTSVINAYLFKYGLTAVSPEVFPGVQSMCRRGLELTRHEVILASLSCSDPWQFLTKYVVIMFPMHYVLSYHWWQYSGLAASFGDILTSQAKKYR